MGRREGSSNDPKGNKVADLKSSLSLTFYGVQNVLFFALQKMVV